jgi:hypothetical protein
MTIIIIIIIIMSLFDSLFIYTLNPTAKMSIIEPVLIKKARNKNNYRIIIIM